MVPFLRWIKLSAEILKSANAFEPLDLEGLLGPDVEFFLFLSSASTFYELYFSEVGSTFFGFEIIYGGGGKPGTCYFG